MRLKCRTADERTELDRPLASPAVMRALVVLVIATVAGLPAALGAQAAGEEQGVLTAVQRLFDAMAAGDSAEARAVLVPEGSFTSVTTRDGSTTYRVTPHERVIAQLGAATEQWSERIWDARVEVHGPIATVSAPYDFRRGDVFSHCGVDVFTLVRTAGSWTIASAIYTVEREGCGGGPPGGSR